jgi:hypothetical protein
MMRRVQAPEGRKKVAGGKRSAAPGRNGLKKSPGRGERRTFFRPCRGSEPRLQTGGRALHACPRLPSYAPPGQPRLWLSRIEQSVTPEKSHRVASPPATLD